MLLSLSLFFLDICRGSCLRRYRCGSFVVVFDLHVVSFLVIAAKLVAVFGGADNDVAVVTVAVVIAVFFVVFAVEVVDDVIVVSLMPSLSLSVVIVVVVVAVNVVVVDVVAVVVVVVDVNVAVDGIDVVAAFVARCCHHCRYVERPFRCYRFRLFWCPSSFLILDLGPGNGGIPPIDIFRRCLILYKTSLFSEVCRVACLHLTKAVSVI